MKEDENIVRTWTNNSRIYCIVKGENNQEEKKVINSPDDLLKLGWDEDKMKQSGIYIDI